MEVRVLASWCSYKFKLQRQCEWKKKRQWNPMIRRCKKKTHLKNNSIAFLLAEQKGKSSRLKELAMLI